MFTSYVTNFQTLLSNNNTKGLVHCRTIICWSYFLTPLLLLLTRYWYYQTLVSWCFPLWTNLQNVGQSAPGLSRQTCASERSRVVYRTNQELSIPINTNMQAHVCGRAFHIKSMLMRRHTSYDMAPKSKHWSPTLPNTQRACAKQALA